MGTRILIHVATAAQTPAELPAEARQLLDHAGATQIQASHPELPGLITAIVPEGVNVPKLIEDLKRSPGVRHAEPDEYRWTQ